MNQRVLQPPIVFDGNISILCLPSPKSRPSLGEDPRSQRMAQLRYYCHSLARNLNPLHTSNDDVQHQQIFFSLKSLQQSVVIVTSWEMDADDSLHESCSCKGNVRTELSCPSAIGGRSRQALASFHMYANGACVK